MEMRNILSTILENANFQITVTLSLDGQLISLQLTLRTVVLLAVKRIPTGCKCHRLATWQVSEAQYAWAVPLPPCQLPNDRSPDSRLERQVRTTSCTKAMIPTFVVRQTSLKARPCA